MDWFPTFEQISDMHPVVGRGKHSVELPSLLLVAVQCKTCCVAADLF